jgi:hypothetical protein
MDENKKSIKELVIERLAKSGPESHERLIVAMTEAEMSKRHDTLLKAVKLIEEAENQAKAASRPDVQTFNVEGVVQTSAYSQNALKAYKAAKEKVSKLQTAFDLALESGSADAFNKLTQLVNQGGNQAKAPAAEEVRAGN